MSNGRMSIAEDREAVAPPRIEVGDVSRASSEKAGHLATKISVRDLNF
jgi:hypothetical protein